MGLCDLGGYSAGKYDCTGTFQSESSVGNYTTNITVTGLSVGHKYAFAVSQYGGSSSLTISCVSGLDAGFIYQSKLYEDTSGSPGLVIGIATATSAVFKTSSHNGGTTIAAILLA